jgi:type II secretory pathway pseudopilin PulG
MRYKHTILATKDETEQSLRLPTAQAGFSIVELCVVVIIVLIVAAGALPTLVTSLRMARLRGASSDYAGLLEQDRINAIKDNRFYSTYIQAGTGNSPVSEVFVDMYPKSLTGASGNGGASIDPKDPVITISSDTIVQPVGNAPNTSNLESQLLPATTPVTPTDGSVTPPTFGPRGLPCTPVTFTGANGGTICDNSGGATAFWTFFENASASSWQAVTVTPAGRIQKWYYAGTYWVKL